MKLMRNPGKFLLHLMQGFGVPVLICVFVAAVEICRSVARYASDFFYDFDQKPYTLLSSIGWCALCWAVADCCRIPKGCTGRKWRWSKGWIAGLLGAASVLTFPNNDEIYVGLALMMVCFAFHFIAGREQQPQRLSQICARFFTSLGLSIVLFLALQLIVTAFEGLFLPDLSYSTSSIISDSVMCTVFFVIAPCLFFGSQTLADEPVSPKAGFRRFARVVLLPLYLLLLAVLVGYVLKILVTWSMPVGVMNSYALAALAMFSFFHLILTGEESRLCRIFLRWGGLALIPVLIAQAVGVWIRYDAYGFTSARIIGIALTLLFAAVVITSIIGKRANWFFVAAGILAAVVIASPFNAGTLARLDQEARLQAALNRNGMFTADGQIVPNPQAVSADRTIVYSAVDYLADTDAPEGSLTHTLQTQLEEIRESLKLNYINDSCKLSLLGFRQSDEWWLRSVTYKGNAVFDEVDAHGFAHAKWLGGTFRMPDPEDEDDLIVSEPPFMQANFSVNGVTDSLDSFFDEGATPVFPDVPLIITFGDEQACLDSMIASAIDVTADHTSRSTRSYEVTQDEVTLPSGMVFRLCQIAFNDYREYSSDYITVTGWLLTPEAE